MAGAFSGHIIGSHIAAIQSQAPFGSPSGQCRHSHISAHGPMSFNPQMHGTFQNQPSFSYNDPDPLSSFQSLSDATIIKINALQTKLNQKLGPEFISQRPGPGGGKLTYAEGWKIINLANEVFGFNGWSSNVVNLTTDFIDFSEESKKFTVGVTAIVRVTLRDGVFHEDVGYGMLENSKSKGAALDKVRLSCTPHPSIDLKTHTHHHNIMVKCKKEAVTDALKRSLRNFGNLLGNCLYDKSYTQEVVKIKVQPPKFDKNELHRRPEFAESKPKPVASTSAPMNTKVDLSASASASTSAKPSSSIPPHMRSEATPNAKPSTSSHVTPPPPYNRNDSASTARKGLNTPIQTPVQRGSAIQISTRPQQQPRPQQPRQPHQPQSQSPEEPAIQDQPQAQEPQDQEPSIPDPEHGDESFSYSDDDAFLAAVDLGEGDIGRPIDFEEGAGTGDDDGDMSTVSFRSMGASGSGSMGPPTTNTGVIQRNVNTNAQDQHRPLEKSSSTLNLSSSSVVPASARNQNAHQSTTHTSTRATAAQQQQQQHRSGQAHSHPRTHPNISSCRSVVDTASSRPVPVQVQKQNQTPNMNMNTNQNTNENNNNNNNNNTNGATSTARKPITPAMGGFHFPPGVVCSEVECL